MAGRHFHLSNGSLFFTWLIAGIVLLVLPRDKTSRVWDLFRSAFNPVLRIGRPVQDDYPPTPLNPDDAVGQEQYRQLWKDYNNLKATLRTLHSDYERLASIRSQLPRAYGAVVMARVIGPLSSYRHEIVINKGRNDGVRQGQYVLSADKNCIVGVISECSEGNAILRVLTDSKLSLEVRIVNEEQERDIQGLMFGNGKSACKIKMIEREKKIDVGDVVFADAKPGYLNVPMVVGEVSAVEPDDEHPLLWDITVQPAQDMTRLDDVAVIVIEDF